jgi:hypothetical protein
MKLTFIFSLAATLTNNDHVFLRLHRRNDYHNRRYTSRVIGSDFPNQNEIVPQILSAHRGVQAIDWETNGWIFLVPPEINRDRHPPHKPIDMPVHIYLPCVSSARDIARTIFHFYFHFAHDFSLSGLLHSPPQ